MSYEAKTCWVIRRSDITREWMIFANEGTDTETSYTGSVAYIGKALFYPKNAPPEPIPAEIVSAYRLLLERS